MLSLSWRPAVSLLSLDLEPGLASNLILILCVRECRFNPETWWFLDEESNENSLITVPTTRNLTSHVLALTLRWLIGSILQAKRKEKAEMLNSPQWMLVSESCCMSTHLVLLESCKTLEEVSVISKLTHTSGFSASPRHHCIHCNIVNTHTHLVKLLRHYSALRGTVVWIGNSPYFSWIIVNCYIVSMYECQFLYNICILHITNTIIHYYSPLYHKRYINYI